MLETNSCKNVVKISMSIFFHSECFIDLTMSIRFIVRDFVYSDDLQFRQQEELDIADTTEKELWVCDLTEL